MSKTKQGILRFFRYLYLKLFRINDSPQKISLGFGLGVFLGVFPGVGPIAALALSLIFRVNRASAVLGSLITNTWISIVTFALAVKTGSMLFGLDWNVVRAEWSVLSRNLSVRNLLEFRDEAAAVMTGYVLISLIIGGVAYLAALLGISIFRRRFIAVKRG